MAPAMYHLANQTDSTAFRSVDDIESHKQPSWQSQNQVQMEDQARFFPLYRHEGKQRNRSNQEEHSDPVSLRGARGTQRGYRHPTVETPSPSTSTNSSMFVHSPGNRHRTAAEEAQADEDATAAVSVTSPRTNSNTSVAVHSSAKPQQSEGSSTPWIPHKASNIKPAKPKHKGKKQLGAKGRVAETSAHHLFKDITRDYMKRAQSPSISSTPRQEQCDNMPSAPGTEEQLQTIRQIQQHLDDFHAMQRSRYGDDNGGNLAKPLPRSLEEIQKDLAEVDRDMEMLKNLKRWGYAQDSHHQRIGDDDDDDDDSSNSSGDGGGSTPFESCCSQPSPDRGPAVSIPEDTQPFRTRWDYSIRNYGHVNLYERVLVGREVIDAGDACRRGRRRISERL